MASRETLHLPVQVDSDVLEKNPKFCQLMSVLATRLAPDGITVDKKRQLEIARKNLRMSRQGWLTNQIVYNELRDLLLEMELMGVEGRLGLEQEQLTQALSQAVTFSELTDYLPLPATPSQNHNLLGLTAEDLDRYNPVKLQIPSIQRAVLPLLEERLMKKYQGLVEFYTSDGESTVGRNANQEEFCLPGLVEETNQRVTREKNLLLNLEMRRRDGFLVYYKVLLECLSAMQRIVCHHKMEVQAVSDKVTLDWMESWVLANVTKAKLTQLQLDCDTYSPNTVAALKVIRTEVDTAIGECQKALAKATQQLDTYRSVGSEFKLLVDQYTTLKKEIDDCSWGLKHFGMKGKR